MHLLVRDTRSLDEAETAVDLGQSPADLVLLSFSDSDLGAAAAAWQGADGALPSLRLANLAQLRHPMSVDLYLDRVVARARVVVVRLLGGLDYWRYGAEELGALCRDRGIALALLPGDERDDGRLAELSTVPAASLARLADYLRQGGPENCALALGYAAHLGGLGADAAAPALTLPDCGEHAPLARSGGALSVIVFYRSQLLAGDIAPVVALADALAARGLAVRALQVNSLKDPATAAFVAGFLRRARPAVVLGATGFAARQDAQGSPLDAAGVPVLQLVLAGSAQEAWQASARGLAAADLAMQVVLPELDGRLLTTAISFKAAEPELAALQYTRQAHRPYAAGIALAADRAAGWARLAGTPRAERLVAIVLSDYPGATGQVGHAVGLDTLASLALIVDLLRDAGYAIGQPTDATALCDTPPAAFLSLADYHRRFAALPAAFREQVVGAWGAPEHDCALQQGRFVARHLRLGRLTVAVQPDRGAPADRRATYHDPALPPRHAYVAFHLWLRGALDVHALVQLGAHGTLEWLPGKAAALSENCAPAALLGGLPVIYPFIVSNPGEAAAAKRRLGAVILGHLTPPVIGAGLHGAAAELERLIDDYAAADGLDARRTALLRRAILEHAEAAGLRAECGAAAEAPDDETLARLDAYLCDVKDMRIRDGLHVFGRAPDATCRAALLAAFGDGADPAVGARLDACAEAERGALLAALDGRFVPPGPAGAPTRGRADVLPTGRNLYGIDPRAVPTRAAVQLAERNAEALLRRHRQEHGDWPRRLVLDLWGSATMRTGGEELALALLLLGARPLWDDGSNRVGGIEVLPLALLDRPRIDVTLRISGLFRDAFATQIALFDQTVRAIAARDEASDWNPLAAAARGLAGAALRRATVRVFGAAPGCYGAGVSTLTDRGDWRQRDDLADSYLAASAHAYGQGIEGGVEREAFEAVVRAADAFVHPQDHAETDLLDSVDHAAHAGGFAAAAASLGGAPALYHADTSQPEAPRVRTLDQEIARVVRGRAANPRWIAGQLRHGYRGAAEIARSAESLFAFAATLPTRLDRQFDLLFDATLGDAPVDRLLASHNPDARRAMAERFEEAVRRGLWRPRRNSVASRLAETLAR